MVDPHTLHTAEDELNRSSPDLTYDLRAAGRNEVRVRVWGAGFYRREGSSAPDLSCYVRVRRRAAAREIVRRVRAVSGSLFRRGYGARE